MKRRGRRIALGLALGIALISTACGPDEEPFDGEVVGNLFEVLPTQVPVGTTAELRGFKMGTEQRDGWVTVGGVPARIQAWSSDRILIEVPAVGPGEVLVVINWPNLRSNAVPLTVLP